MTPAMVYALTMMGVLAAGVLLTLVLARRHRDAARVAGVVNLMALALGLGLAVEVTRGGTAEASLALLTAFKSSVTLRADGFALLLLLTLLFVALWAVLFSTRYMPSVRTRAVGRYYPAFLLMVLSAAAVLLAGDLLLLFIAWEFISLPAFLLIVHQDRRTESVRAGINYLVLNGVGGLALLTALLIIYPHTESYSFGDVQAALRALVVTRPWLVNLIIGLLMLPFGTKAGLFPTGDWAPAAYSAATCPAAALLSGVVSKLGPYAALRTLLWVLPVDVMPVGWLEYWGMALGVWGAASILLGSSAAVVADDSKRLLAFSSVSQSGYMFMAIGVALAALNRAPTVANLALIGCCVHMVADALAKGALFLVTGSVGFRTATNDLNKLGGLESQMPRTTLVAVAGAASLAGLPLTGAFVSKWLIIQSALWLGPAHAVFLACVVVALLGSVLAVAYGLKFVGTIFLGPQSKLVALVQGGEAPGWMGVTPAVLAAGSYVIGLLPALLIRPIVTSLPAAPGRFAAQALSEVSVLRIVPMSGATPAGALSPLWLLGLLAVGVAAAWGWSRSGGAPVRASETWACGELVAADEMRPRGAGYFWALSRYLARVYTQIGLPTFASGQQRWQTLESDRWGFERLSGGLWAVARGLARLQSGLVQHYVLWQLLGAIIIALVVLLASR